MAVFARTTKDDERKLTKTFCFWPRRVGRHILICGRKRSYFPFQCFIGPDWTCMCLTYALIIAPSVLFIAKVGPHSPPTPAPREAPSRLETASRVNRTCALHQICVELHWSVLALSSISFAALLCAYSMAACRYEEGRTKFVCILHRHIAGTLPGLSFSDPGIVYHCEDTSINATSLEGLWVHGFLWE